MNIIDKYVQDKGARASHYLGEFPGYGGVWQIQYGDIDDEGRIEPTGLPVLIYIVKEEVRVIPFDKALDIIASL